MTETVVKTGTWLYDGQVVCDVRIVYSPIRFGSGDPVDPPEDDEERPSYYVEYGGPQQRHAFVGGGGCFDSLEDAVRGASERVPGLAWND
jgi:hypothetical protein